MKRLVLFFLALAGAGVAHAGPFEWQGVQDPYLVAYTTSGVVTSTSIIMVDLSDTTNWPHRASGNIDVFAVRADISKAAGTASTLKVGVITRVNATNADVKWIWTKTYAQDAAGTHYSDVFTMPNYSIRAKVKEGGITPYIVTNDSTSATTTFQTDVNLPTPLGITSPNVTSGVGDIVLSYTPAGSPTQTTLRVDLLYIAEK